MPTDDESTGRLLREARAQAELADRLGVSRHTIMRYENGFVPEIARLAIAQLLAFHSKCAAEKPAR